MIDNNSKLSIADLSNPELLNYFRDNTNNVVIPENNVQQSWWFVKNIGGVLRINPSFKQSHTELAAGYYLLLYKLSFLTLEFLSDSDIIDLIQNHIAKAFELPSWFDLWGKLRLILVSRYETESRDGFKTKVREAMELNNERLTETNINRVGERVEGTVSNWINDYRVYVGNNSETETLRVAEYFTSAQNTKLL